jgi:hypothetical protein
MSIAVGGIWCLKSTEICKLLFKGMRREVVARRREKEREREREGGKERLLHLGTEKTVPIYYQYTDSLRNIEMAHCA